MSRPLSRRRFLGQLNCAAISSLPILNTLVNLRAAGSAAAATAPTGHRALVCLFLSGGIDTFNVLVPRGGAGKSILSASLLGAAWASGVDAIGMDMDPRPSLRRWADERVARGLRPMGPVVPRRPSRSRRR